MAKKTFYSEYAKQWVLVVLLLVLISFTQSCTEDLFGGEPSYEPDNEAPSVFILNPTSEEMFVTTDNKLVISGTAQDNGILKSVTYTASNGLSGTASGLEQWSFSDLELSQGDNLVTVTAIDEGGNKGSASITITRNKYLTFLGTPFVDNDILYTGEPKQVWITVNIAPNDRLIASSVKVIQVDESNNEIEEVCPLYDDGNLEHGDEIKGDNVFSTLHTFAYPTEGTRRFRVSAKTMEDEGEVEGLSAVFTLTVLDQQNAAQQVQNMINVHQMIEQKMVSLGSVPASEKAEMLVQWLQTEPAVKYVTNDKGFITITHVSGLESYVSLTGTGCDFKGGTTDFHRGDTPALPLSRQTRGAMKYSSPRRAHAAAPSTVNSENIIQNKNVLIWAPYEDSFPIDMEPSLSKIFSTSPVEFKVEHLSNSKCTRETLKHLNKYGIIIIDTHGKGGNLIYTREKVGFSEFLIPEDIYNLFSSNYRMVTMDDNVTYYAVTAKFIKNKIEGKLPNSVVFNGSCESMKTLNLANAFIAKGAKTYLGFKEIVSCSHSKEKADEFFSALVGDELKTTGQAYIPDNNLIETDGTTTWYNPYLMSGSKDMHFYMGLVNGDFEYGNLNGWDTSGDGRVITQLGSLMPTQGTFMGIVSTGLGYTEKYGCISQSFRVTGENTLSIKWNFLSEEFLEYVGSHYQDYLKITITDGVTPTVLFSMAIDGFAANYNLSKVSPDIVFDRGDVYMTGWKTTTFDISKYHGKNVTITIETGDIGDSIYDSVTLLDEISIY